MGLFIWLACVLPVVLCLGRGSTCSKVHTYFLFRTWQARKENRRNLVRNSGSSVADASFGSHLNEDEAEDLLAFFRNVAPQAFRTLDRTRNASEAESSRASYERNSVASRGSQGRPAINGDL